MGGLFAERLARIGSQNEFKIADDIARAEAMGMKVVRLNLGEPDCFLERIASNQLPHRFFNG